MITLFKKDLRVLREPIWGLIIVTLGALILPMSIGWLGAWHDKTPFTIREAAQLLVGSSYLGFATLALMASAIGASSFATERRERWADFLAMLPVSRQQIVISKLLVAACLILAAFILWLIVGLVAFQLGGVDRGYFGRSVFTTGGCILMLFAFSWAASVFLRSSAFAAGLAIGLVFALYFTATTLLHTGPEPFNQFHADVLDGCAYLASSVVITASSILYCRRISP